jgi:hypothetical protein
MPSCACGNDLQHYQAENEEKLWLHSGMEQVNESLRGEKELNQLSQDVLNAVADYIDAQAGLFYVRQDNIAAAYRLLCYFSEENVPRGRLRWAKRSWGGCAERTHDAAGQCS